MERLSPYEESVPTILLLPFLRLTVSVVFLWLFMGLSGFILVEIYHVGNALTPDNPINTSPWDFVNIVPNSLFDVKDYYQIPLLQLVIAVTVSSLIIFSVLKFILQLGVLGKFSAYGRLIFGSLTPITLYLMFRPNIVRYVDGDFSSVYTPSSPPPSLFDQWNRSLLIFLIVFLTLHGLFLLSTSNNLSTREILVVMRRMIPSAVTLHALYSMFFNLPYFGRKFRIDVAQLTPWFADTGQVIFQDILEILIVTFVIQLLIDLVSIFVSNNPYLFPPPREVPTYLSLLSLPLFSLIIGGLTLTTSFFSHGFNSPSNRHLQEVDGAKNPFYVDPPYILFPPNEIQSFGNDLFGRDILSIFNYSLGLFLVLTLGFTVLITSLSLLLHLFMGRRRQKISRILVSLTDGTPRPLLFSVPLLPFLWIHSTLVGVHDHPLVIKFSLLAPVTLIILFVYSLPPLLSETSGWVKALSTFTSRFSVFFVDLLVICYILLWDFTPSGFLSSQLGFSTLHRGFLMFTDWLFSSVFLLLVSSSFPVEKEYFLSSEGEAVLYPTKVSV